MIAGIIGSDSSAKVIFYLSNHRGDTLLAYRDDNGTETLVAKYRYDAFGNRRTDSNYCYENQNETDNLPRYTFSTKEYLSDAELYLYVYRVYDPIAGRWTQRDPIDYQDSVNLYQFCGNNPVNLIDISGLAKVEIEYRVKENGKYVNKTEKFKKNTPAQDINDFMDSLPDESITEITITGHGSEDDIRIDDTTGDSLSVSDGRLTSGEVDFTDTLKKKFAKKAQMHLKGCSTAKGNNNITKKVWYRMGSYPIILS